MKSEFRLDFLGIRVHYITGEDSLKSFRRFRGKKLALASAGLSCDLGDSEFLIYQHDKDCQYTLIHECVHCAHFIMQHAGIPINLANTEIQAYLISHLVEMCDTTL